MICKTCLPFCRFFLIVYDAVQKFLNSILLYLWIFVVVVYDFGIMLKKLLPRPVSMSFISMFASSFTVSDLVFNSLIHLEWTFVSVVR